MSITKLLSVAAVLGLATACNSNSTRAEAREDVIEARSEARQDAAEAMRNDDPAHTAERVAEINQDLAKSHKEAYHGVDEQGRAHAQAGGAVAGGSAVSYERFEALEDESNEAFLTRADSAIRRVETDLTAIGTPKNNDEDYYDAKEAIANAKKSLSEARQKPDDAVFDGKVRVAVAINSAQREVSELADDQDDQDDQNDQD